MKHLQSRGQRPNRYFWRTTEQVEIDYVEEQDGMLSAFEFKWQGRPTKVPAAFERAYPNSLFQVIDRENFETFIE